VDETGQVARPERMLAVLLLVGAVWLTAGVLVWLAWVLARGGWLPWLPLSLLALAVPFAQARAALLLLRPGPPGADADGSRIGRALGTAAGLSAAVLPLPLTGQSLGSLQPGLAPLPVLFTVAGGAGALMLLLQRHGLGIDRLAGPPPALVLSATALALVWVGLALDQGSLLAVVLALPAGVIVVLAALRGPAGYRAGLMLGWWWGLVTTGGSLLVAGLFLGLVYGQAWAGLVVLGIAVSLAAAWFALRAVPAHT
jgi:hypothetical protein